MHEARMEHRARSYTSVQQERWPHSIRDTAGQSMSSHAGRCNATKVQPERHRADQTPDLGHVTAGRRDPGTCYPTQGGGEIDGSLITIRSSKGLLICGLLGPVTFQQPHRESAHPAWERDVGCPAPALPLPKTLSSVLRSRVASARLKAFFRRAQCRPPSPLSRGPYFWVVWTFLDQQSTRRNQMELA